MLQIARLAGIAALAAAMLAGTAVAKTPKDQLIIGMNMANLTSLDPHNMNSYETHHILGNVYDTLVRTDPKDASKLLPSVAEAWTFGEDGSITFTLREGIKFHSGRPVTAQDVAGSFHRNMRLGLLGAGPFREWGYTAANIEQMFQATDARTFVIKPAKKLAPKLKLFALARSVGSILDMEEVRAHEKAGDNARGWLASNSAGSGPYRLVRWNANDIVLMDRFDGYWGGPPKMRRIVVRHIPESQTQRLQLEGGDLDVGFQLSPADFDALANHPNVTVERIPGAGFYYFATSGKDPDLGKPAVRAALRWCIDYEGINSGIMKNYGLPAQNLVPQGNPAAIEPFGQKLDVERCRRELAAAGYPNGFKKTLNVLSSPPYAEIATAIQATMAKAGVQAEILRGNGEQTYGPMRNRQFQMVIGRSNATPQGDPDGWMRTLYNPDNRDEAKLSNLLAWRTSFYVPEVNRLIDEAASLTDDARRMPLYQEAQRIAEREILSVIPVSQRVDPFALSKRVKNYVGDPTWMVRWDVVEKTD